MGKVIFYIFLKFILGSIGYIFGYIDIFVFLVVKTMYFSSTFVAFNDLVSFSNLCENEDF